MCDLGLARDIESGCRELTEYVVTRWYRAPEIMLACQEYNWVREGTGVLGIAVEVSATLYEYSTPI